eukprot:2437175-Pyramimonas_sp.AAC.1
MTLVSALPIPKCSVASQRVPNKGSHWERRVQPNLLAFQFLGCDLVSFVPLTSSGERWTYSFSSIRTTPPLRE